MSFFLVETTELESGDWRFAVYYVVLCRVASFGCNSHQSVGKSDVTGFDLPEIHVPHELAKILVRRSFWDVFGMTFGMKLSSESLITTHYFASRHVHLRIELIPPARMV